MKTTQQIFGKAALALALALRLLGEDELDNYAPGEAIKFANYSLVQTPDKTIYLLVDKEKRPSIRFAKISIGFFSFLPFVKFFDSFV